MRIRRSLRVAVVLFPLALILVLLAAVTGEPGPASSHLLTELAARL